MDDANPIAQLGGEFQHALFLQDHEAMGEPQGGVRIRVGADGPAEGLEAALRDGWEDASRGGRPGRWE